MYWMKVVIFISLQMYKFTKEGKLDGLNKLKRLQDIPNFISKCQNPI